MESKTRALQSHDQSPDQGVLGGLGEGGCLFLASGSQLYDPTPAERHLFTHLKTVTSEHTAGVFMAVGGGVIRKHLWPFALTPPHATLRVSAPESRVSCVECSRVTRYHLNHLARASSVAAPPAEPRQTRPNPPLPVVLWSNALRRLCGLERQPGLDRVETLACVGRQKRALPLLNGGWG